MNTSFRNANGRIIYHPYIPLQFAYQQPIYTNQLFNTNQSNQGFNTNYQTNQGFNNYQTNQGFNTNYQTNLTNQKTTANNNETSGTPMEIDEEDNNKKTEVIEIVDNSDSDYLPESDSDSDSDSDKSKKEVKKTYKKKYISLVMKKKVWEKYIGLEIGQQKCKICNINYIQQMSFSCGHVVAEKNGGKTKIENLRPICQSCNSSMNIENMKTFYQNNSGNNISFERLWK